MREFRRSHAHGDLQHPPEGRGRALHPARGVGGELRLRVRRDPGGIHGLCFRRAVAQEVRRHPRHESSRLGGRRTHGEELALFRSQSSRTGGPGSGPFSWVTTSLGPGEDFQRPQLGFRAENAKTGAYDFWTSTTSSPCTTTSKWHKFGFTRTFDNLSWRSATAA